MKQLLGSAVAAFLILFWCIAIIVITILCATLVVLGIWGDYEYIKWFFRSSFEVEGIIFFFIGIMLLSLTVGLTFTFAFLQFPYEKLCDQVKILGGEIRSLEIGRAHV